MITLLISSVRVRAGTFFLSALLLTACGADQADAPEGSVEAESGREVLYWYDPMRPEAHFDEPGRSPFMDMELVPMYANGAADASGILVPPGITQGLGVRIGTVSRDSVQPQLRTVARVRADQDTRWKLVSRAPGWVEGLHVHEVGDAVRAGQVLAEIYSPELVQAQEELTLSAATAPAAAERLRRLGIAESDIEAVREAGQSRRRLPLRAPIAGSVAEIRVHHGSRVLADQALLEIVASDSVWIEARLFPGQAEWLGEPLGGRFRLPRGDAAEWRSEHGYLYPLADPVSQTQSVRFVLDESTRRLPPGLWLDAELRGAARENVLLVPAEAVIRTGSGNRVVTALPGSRFQPVEVRLGRRYGERYEILDGLAEGDAIVTSGQFLLDSEAELRAGTGRLSSGPARATGHDEHRSDDLDDVRRKTQPAEPAPATEHDRGH